MSKPSARFTQSEIARVMRAAKAEGMTIEIRPDGSIRVVPIEAREQPVDWKGSFRL